MDTSKSVINQLKEMLLLFQPEPITTLPSIEPHIPLADAPSTIPRNPLLEAKPILKTPAREQRVHVTPEKKVSFLIPNTSTLSIIPNPPGPAALPSSRDPPVYQQPTALVVSPEPTVPGTPHYYTQPSACVYSHLNYDYSLFYRFLPFSVHPIPYVNT